MGVDFNTLDRRVLSYGTSSGSQWIEGDTLTRLYSFFPGSPFIVSRATPASYQPGGQGDYRRVDGGRGAELPLWMLLLRHAQHTGQPSLLADEAVAREMLARYGCRERELLQIHEWLFTMATPLPTESTGWRQAVLDKSFIPGEQHSLYGVSAIADGGI